MMEIYLLFIIIVLSTFSSVCCQQGTLAQSRAVYAANFNQRPLRRFNSNPMISHCSEIKHAYRMKSSHRDAQDLNVDNGNGGSNGGSDGSSGGGGKGGKKFIKGVNEFNRFRWYNDLLPYLMVCPPVMQSLDFVKSVGLKLFEIVSSRNFTSRFGFLPIWGQQSTYLIDSTDSGVSNQAQNQELQSAQSQQLYDHQVERSNNQLTVDSGSNPVDSTSTPVAYGRVRKSQQQLQNFIDKKFLLMIQKRIAAAFQKQNKLTQTSLFEFADENIPDEFTRAVFKQVVLQVPIETIQIVFDYIIKDVLEELNQEVALIPIVTDILQGVEDTVSSKGFDIFENALNTFVKTQSHVQHLVLKLHPIIMKNIKERTYPTLVDFYSVKFSCMVENRLRSVMFSIMSIIAGPNYTQEFSEHLIPMNAVFREDIWKKLSLQTNLLADADVSYFQPKYYLMMPIDQVSPSVPNAVKYALKIIFGPIKYTFDVVLCVALSVIKAINKSINLTVRTVANLNHVQTAVFQYIEGQLFDIYNRKFWLKKLPQPVYLDNSPDANKQKNFWKYFDWNLIVMNMV